MNLLQVSESLGAGKEVMSALAKLNGGVVSGNRDGLTEGVG